MNSSSTDFFCHNGMNKSRHVPQALRFLFFPLLKLRTVILLSLCAPNDTDRNSGLVICVCSCSCLLNCTISLFPSYTVGRPDSRSQLCAFRTYSAVLLTCFVKSFLDAPCFILPCTACHALAAEISAGCQVAMSIFGEFGGDAVVRIGSPCTLTHYINQEDAGSPAIEHSHTPAQTSPSSSDVQCIR